MENMENMQELMQLKQQMSILKTQLNKNVIITDEKIEKVTQISSSRRPILMTFLAILASLVSSLGLIQNIFFSSGRYPIWILGLFVVCILSSLAFWIITVGGKSYTIKDDVLTVGYLLGWLKIGKWSYAVIPVEKIRFIEHLAHPRLGRSLRIMYNTYDDIYLDPDNLSEFIGALVSINPEIEVRYEKK